MWNQLKTYFLSALIIGLAAVAVYYKYIPQRAEVIRTVDVPALVRQIQQLHDLVTVKYSIQKVVGLKEQKVPFGTEQVLIMVQAKVLGGVDLQAITARQDGATLTVELPAAKILDVSIDDKTTQVWDRSKSWWAPWAGLNPDLEQSARRAALVDVQLAAEQMGILSNAQVNAAQSIRQLLATLGHTNVTVTVRL